MARLSPRSVTVAAVASVFLVASVGPVLAVAATETPNDHERGLERATVEHGFAASGDAPVPLQTDDDRYHQTAVLGIAVLFVLGSVLVARNRLRDRSTINPDRSSPEPEEFLSDRERVRRLVEENGGRMKQAEIVDSVEWSKAKVSRLLADLESDGEIVKLRLGRENLICLDGYEPPASQPSESTGHK